MDEQRFAQQAEEAERWLRLAERAEETFWGRLGCKVIQADGSKTSISLAIEPSHLNLLGIVHGGVLMSMMDNAMGLLVMLAESNERTVTANMNTHFLASSRGGTLICKAEFMHRTGRTITLQSSVTDEDGKLLAWGSGAYRMI
ncbi:PaaI family thioesterase [Paenibacillus sp. LHD-117]|uniref:PaaI family thioesterase n=1 Tax=Paenibacillus sp. LHD-117 TaxID=3071412 RepID=UPI0027DECB90|nr:PaaI family thioesterase [Paenibacillus sp. LHD-117]MDQ6421307.1 PaaI family thioesterase [Paenibacillus sp. LHD-117]